VCEGDGCRLVLTADSSDSLCASALIANVASPLSERSLQSKGVKKEFRLNPFLSVALRE
jgi:hypothetical protein